MPGGGAAFGRPPRDMGAAELTVETILRTIATLTIGLLFGTLALNADLDSKCAWGRRPSAFRCSRCLSCTRPAVTAK